MSSTSSIPFCVVSSRRGPVSSKGMSGTTKPAGVGLIPRYNRASHFRLPFSFLSLGATVLSSMGPCSLQSHLVSQECAGNWQPFIQQILTGETYACNCLSKTLSQRRALVLTKHGARTVQKLCARPRGSRVSTSEYVFVPHVLLSGRTESVLHSQGCLYCQV